MPSAPSTLVRGPRRRRGGQLLTGPTFGQCFEAKIERAIDGWTVRIPEIGATTFAVRRAEVELAARECIAVRTGIPIGYVAAVVVDERG